MGERIGGPAPPAARPAEPPRAQRLAGVLAGIWDGAVAARVREGRLRDVGWPRGLRAVVTISSALMVLAGLVSLASSWLRRTSDLVVPTSASSSLPEAYVWVLSLFLVVAVALIQTAGLHGPWWVRLIATGLTLLVMGSWGLRNLLLSNPLVLVVQLLLMTGVVALTLARWRRWFAWWEFPVALALVGSSIAVALAEVNVQLRFVGGELAPQLVQGTISTLVVLVIPAAVAAGTAVAEVTVGLTMVGVARVARLPGRRWPYVLLGIVAGLLALQLLREILGRDPVARGWLAFLPALAVMTALALVAGAVLRTSRRSGAGLPVSVLPEELGRIAFPVSALLVALILSLIGIATAAAILAALDPTGAIARSTVFDRVRAISESVDLVRLLLAVAFLVAAFRAARHGRSGVGLLLGCIGVTVIATTMRALTGQRWAVEWDPDALNVLAGAAGLALVGWYAAGRRLTVGRALAGTALLGLSLLYSIRPILGDPVGELIGYSGIAVVLFGVAWDFLTASDWGNRDSRRFPRPTRVLLVLANTALLSVVIAYGSLVREVETGPDIEGFVELGDLVLGTGLLAAAYVAVIRLLIDDRAVS